MTSSLVYIGEKGEGTHFDQSRPKNRTENRTGGARTHGAIWKLRGISTTEEERKNTEIRIHPDRIFDKCFLKPAFRKCNGSQK